MGRTRSSLLRRIRRARFWVEAGLSVTSAVLLALTLFVPDWIEAVFVVDPDRHSGSLEWALDGVLLATAAAAGVLARIEWRRPGLNARAEPVSSSSHPR
jgi:hypothetical protein